MYQLTYGQKLADSYKRRRYYAAVRARRRRARYRARAKYFRRSHLGLGGSFILPDLPLMAALNEVVVDAVRQKQEELVVKMDIPPVQGSKRGGGEIVTDDIRPPKAVGVDDSLNGQPPEKQPRVQKPKPKPRKLKDSDKLLWDNMRDNKQRQVRRRLDNVRKSVLAGQFGTLSRSYLLATRSGGNPRYWYMDTDGWKEINYSQLIHNLGNGGFSEFDIAGIVAKNKDKVVALDYFQQKNLRKDYTAVSVLNDYRLFDESHNTDYGFFPRNARMHPVDYSTYNPFGYVQFPRSTGIDQFGNPQFENYQDLAFADTFDRPDGLPTKFRDEYLTTGKELDTEYDPKLFDTEVTDTGVPFDDVVDHRDEL